jgi:ubiquinone/menaquinone biosynthesis C-methylase UbiE
MRVTGMQEYLEKLSVLEDALKVYRAGKIDNITRISWNLDFKTIMGKAFKASMEGQKILDVGCGLGGYIIALAKQGRECHGVDPLTVISLAKARKKAKEEKAEIFLYRAIGEYLPYKDEMFDLVLCLSTLQHISSQKHTLREIRRVLKHDGRLLTSIPTTRNIHTLFRKTVPEHFTAAYSTAAIKKLLAEAGFQIQETTGSGFFPPLSTKILELYYVVFGEKMTRQLIKTLNKIANFWLASAGNVIALCCKSP